MCCLECLSPFYLLIHAKRPRSPKRYFRSLENEREERALSLSLSLVRSCSLRRVESEREGDIRLYIYISWPRWLYGRADWAASKLAEPGLGISWWSKSGGDGFSNVEMLCGTWIARETTWWEKAPFSLSHRPRAAI